jgi:hypothetical protein
MLGLRVTARLIKGEEYGAKRLPGHDPANVFSPPTGVDAGQTSLLGMQVSTSAPKFDSSAGPDPFCPERRSRSELRSAHVIVIRSDHVLLCCFQKCVPGPRRCVRCKDMGIEDCVYEQVKKRGIGNTLRMGEACACCRSARTTRQYRERRADIRLPPRRPPEQKRG